MIANKKEISILEARKSTVIGRFYLFGERLNNALYLKNQTLYYMTKKLCIGDPSDFFQVF